MKLHKILDNLKSYHKECFQKLKRMDTYPYIVKCYRRIVWETRHSSVTGWELLSLFS